VTTVHLKKFEAIVEFGGLPSGVLYFIEQPDLHQWLCFIQN
jgi:hypothetical protein